jgi:hypothetical protein
MYLGWRYGTLAHSEPSPTEYKPVDSKTGHMGAVDGTPEEADP